VLSHRGLQGGLGAELDLPVDGEHKVVAANRRDIHVLPLRD